MKKPALFLALAFALTGAASTPEKQALTVALSVPMDEGERSLDSDNKYHLHVILTNASGGALNICTDENSWGYWSLSFELSDDKGGKWTVTKKRDMSFEANAPEFWTLQPREQLVLDADLGDGGTWEGMPKDVTGHVYAMRAIYEFQRDKGFDDAQKSLRGKQPPVWTGRIVSGPEKIEFGF